MTTPTILLRPFIQILLNCCKMIFKALEIIYWGVRAVFNLQSTRTLEDQNHLIRHFKLLFLCNNHCKAIDCVSFENELLRCESRRSAVLLFLWNRVRWGHEVRCLQLRKSLFQTLNPYTRTWPVTWPLHYSKWNKPQPAPSTIQHLKQLYYKWVTQYYCNVWLRTLYH